MSNTQRGMWENVFRYMDCSWLRVRLHIHSIRHKIQSYAVNVFHSLAVLCFLCSACKLHYDQTNNYNRCDRANLSMGSLLDMRKSPVFIFVLVYVRIYDAFNIFYTIKLFPFFFSPIIIVVWFGFLFSLLLPDSSNILLFSYAQIGLDGFDL